MLVPPPCGRPWTAGILAFSAKHVYRAKSAYVLMKDHIDAL